MIGSERGGGAPAGFGTCGLWLGKSRSPLFERWGHDANARALAGAPHGASCRTRPARDLADAHADLQDAVYTIIRAAAPRTLSLRIHGIHV